MNEKQTSKKPARRPRIEEQKPVAVTQALRVYAETGSVENAAQVAGCHVRTIRRLIGRDDGFCQVKKALAERAFELSAAAQEVALDRVNELSAMQAAVAAKLSAQSGLELTERGPAVQINMSADVDEAAELAALRADLAELNRRWAEAEGAETALEAGDRKA